MSIYVTSQHELVDELMLAQKGIR